MKLLFREIPLFGRRIPFIIIAWFLLCTVAAVAEISRGSINNYIIFRQSFWHVLDQKELYIPYPGEYFDHFFYGPAFSLVIAPFAVLPDWAGCFFWCIFNAAILLYAILRLQLPKKDLLIIVAITAIEMMTAIHNVQINPLIGALIIMAYVLVEEEKDFWATLFIALGFLVKIYGIMALLFFVFSKHKFRFIWSFALWMIVLICLPMLYSSPQYIVDTYKDWIGTLVNKNQLNVAGSGADVYRDISVMGMIRRITGELIANTFFLVPAALLILLPLLRFNQYREHWYRLSYLAIVLITVIIFSSGAESSTYVVAIPGVAIWYLLNRHRRIFSNIILAFVFVFTILSATDFCPAYLKDNFIRPYSLKALPVFIAWILLIWQIATRKKKSKFIT